MVIDPGVFTVHMGNIIVCTLLGTASPSFLAYLDNFDQDFLTHIDPKNTFGID